MKKIIRITTLILFAIIAPRAKAQQQLGICMGSTVNLTAINNLNLSNPTYSLNPGGITFSGPSYTVAPVSNITYTLYVTGTNINAAVVTTSSTVNITIANPTFSISPSFSIGCGTQSTAMVCINNQNTVPAGGVMNYSFFASSNPTLNIGVNNFGCIGITTPGTYTAVVTDLGNNCQTSSTFSILQNTVAPSIAVSVATQTLSCSVPSVVLSGSSPNNVPGSVSYKWDFQIGGNPNTIPNASVVAMVLNTISPTYTVNGTYTLTITDINNSCTSNSVITLWKNIAPPNVSISGTGNGSPCTTLQTLTNTSTSGIVNGTFPNALPVVATLWEGQGPISQPTAALTNTYLAQETGIYVLTVTDPNNGCVTTGTAYVSLSPTAAFTHTITGGQVVFTNTSTNTYANTSYYWDFGDGNTSLLQNPTHNYMNGGAHLVKFKASNPGILCSDSVIQSVNISGVPCTANSGFSMVPTGVAQVWNVIPDYPWNISAASWSWGDGSFSNALYTSHQYATAGMYSICLSVTLSCGATSSSCASYNVYRGAQQNMILQVNVVSPDLISGLTPINTTGELSWNIVPNPNAGEFKLNLDATTEPMQMIISDLTGHILQDQFIEAQSTSTTINTGNLPVGMYLVTLQSGNMRVTKRMVVNR